jgi:hypothetical protein
MHAALDLMSHLLTQAGEITLPEPTTALPGQQSYVRWDTARGCGLVLTDAGSSLVALVGLVSAALAAGNGLVAMPYLRHRTAGTVFMRALHRAGAPPRSAVLAPVSVSPSAVAVLPQVTFAATDAGLSQTRALQQALAASSANPESPHLKALISLADGPALGEPGFLRRFALPKTVAVRTLHLGADLELPAVTSPSPSGRGLR